MGFGQTEAGGWELRLGGSLPFPRGGVCSFRPAAALPVQPVPPKRVYARLQLAREDDTGKERGQRAWPWQEGEEQPVQLDCLPLFFQGSYWTIDTCPDISRKRRHPPDDDVSLTLQQSTWADPSPPGGTGKSAFEMVEEPVSPILKTSFLLKEIGFIERATAQSSPLVDQLMGVLFNSQPKQPWEGSLGAAAVRASLEGHLALATRDGARGGFSGGPFLGRLCRPSLRLAFAQKMRPYFL